MSQVLVVPRRVLFPTPRSYFTGFAGPEVFDLSHIKESWMFCDKKEAEQRDDWKQIIPYLVVRCPEIGFLSYRRGKTGGEARLHDRFSIGIGGHVEQQDDKGTKVSRLETMITECIDRELSEEFPIKQTPDDDIHFIGCVNADITPVDKVHFGMVFLRTVGRPEALAAQAGETAIVNPCFLGIDCLFADIENYEVWSQSVISAMSIHPSIFCMPEAPMF